MKFNQIILGASLLITIAFAVSAFSGKPRSNNHLAKGPETGFAVVELFTSEGCSSCPPADALVAKILKEDKDKPVYILGLHVDYWNRLGWKDEFSSAEFSARQNRYANWLNLQSVYTPQIVVNGKTEFVGSQEGSLRKAIQTGLQKTSTEQLMLSNVQLSSDKLALQYQTSGKATNRELVVAFVQKAAVSHVTRGENSGSTLAHVNIVRELKNFGLRQNSGSETLTLPKGYNQQGWDVISFLQNTTTGEIVSAQKVVVSGV